MPARGLTRLDIKLFKSLKCMVDAFFRPGLGIAQRPPRDITWWRVEVRKTWEKKDEEEEEEEEMQQEKEMEGGDGVTVAGGGGGGGGGAR